MHSIPKSLFCLAMAGAAWAAEPIDLTRGWSILQDVHSTGEEHGLFRENWNPVGVNAEVSPWESIPRLTHLQLLLAPQPYFGRELRYFNSAPWWYRLRFPTASGARHATLRFEGVDYYAKVWLNEKLLGEHEGYADPFEFEVGDQLKSGAPNLLVVKVSSPWDYPVAGEHGEKDRTFGVIRTMLKGTYEHADTFVQRDVNPVGIWRPVRLIPHEGLRRADFPVVDSRTGNVTVTWPVALDEQPREAQLTLRIVSLPDGTVVAKSSRAVSLRTGENRLEASATVPAPKLWNTWDRGTPSLYRAELELSDSRTAPLVEHVQFGIRTVELKRAKDEMRFSLNGKPIYLRGTTYWPDEYISASDLGRYERDLAAMVRLGINAIRVHVHTENPEFYDLCDRLGIVVLQDSDLNWSIPASSAGSR
jgi:beta-mannosidase